MSYSTSTIAQGCFGKVYKEKYNDTWAAIKKVPQQLISRKDLERECDVYNKVTHPNIVKLLGDIMLKDGKWIIPLEFIFGEDLETAIFKAAKSKIQLTPSTKATIITGMCEGLLHLHSKDVVHQDLKPENIMVEHNTNRAVIIDLGLAKFFRNGLNSATDMGNEAYSPPEVLQRKSQRSQSSDVWAMGKMVAEVCARIRLYTPSVCPAKIKETLKDSPYCSVVCRMVEPEPTLRASMAGVIYEIRRAGVISDALGKKDVLKPPSTTPARSASPSPNRDINPPKKTQLEVNKDVPQFNKNRSPSPMRWERAPRPEFKPLHSQTGLTASPASKLLEAKNQALVPVRKPDPDVTQGFMKMKLYEEAAKGLPHGLPATGRVIVRRFEEKNGEVEVWEQKEVVTRDGKIVKFDDVKINSK